MSSIPVHGTYPGCRYNNHLGLIQGGDQSVFLPSVFLSLSPSLSKNDKKIPSGEDVTKTTVVHVNRRSGAAELSMHL